MVHVVTVVVIFMWHEINGKNDINKRACCILNEDSSKVVSEGEILGCVKAEENLQNQNPPTEAVAAEHKHKGVLSLISTTMLPSTGWRRPLTAYWKTYFWFRVRINWKLDYTISGEITAGLLLCSKARFGNADRAQRKLSRMLLWSKTSFSILTLHVLPLEWIKSFFFPVL